MRAVRWSEGIAFGSPIARSPGYTGLVNGRRRALDVEESSRVVEQEVTDLVKSPVIGILGRRQGSAARHDSVNRLSPDVEKLEAKSPQFWLTLDREIVQRVGRTSAIAPAVVTGLEWRVGLVV